MYTTSRLNWPRGWFSENFPSLPLLSKFHQSGPSIEDEQYKVKFAKFWYAPQFWPRCLANQVLEPWHEEEKKPGCKTAPSLFCIELFFSLNINSCSKQMKLENCHAQFYNFHTSNVNWVVDWPFEPIQYSLLWPYILQGFQVHQGDPRSLKQEKQETILSHSCRAKISTREDSFFSQGNKEERKFKETKPETLKWPHQS